MLELGRSGGHGVGSGVRPVLSGDAVVATVRASNWKEAATAAVGDREWVFTRRRGRLTGRWASDPETAERFCAHRPSRWKDLWTLQLEDTTLHMEHASRWKGTHRYLRDGRPVAESGRTGWGNRPTLAAQQLPVEHQVFLLWVELLLIRRSAAAAS
ncbi:hypothetical protein GB931_06210 [Modestobacter sp. I12A-02628]|uniref:Uncharacterized protein n=1 Tax=Goekera deserti TaxID=2497753 RepID=A0A7K3WAY3_9ACTN|nr:hypothetical protein [Goekera deserti]MPQ97522.1 hypothetical protein [Goekera deserti]NDI47874.1 hypothetical protein [Goekera deserti]NEL53622.1 hypothetical protein [Goekera deserti]